MLDVGLRPAVLGGDLVGSGVGGLWVVLCVVYGVAGASLLCEQPTEQQTRPKMFASSGELLALSLGIQLSSPGECDGRVGMCCLNVDGQAAAGRGSC